MGLHIAMINPLKKHFSQKHSSMIDKNIAFFWYFFCSVTHASEKLCINLPDDVILNYFYMPEYKDNNENLQKHFLHYLNNDNQYMIPYPLLAQTCKALALLFHKNYKLLAYKYVKKHFLTNLLFLEKFNVHSYNKTTQLFADFNNTAQIFTTNTLTLDAMLLKGIPILENFIDTKHPDSPTTEEERIEFFIYAEQDDFCTNFFTLLFTSTAYSDFEFYKAYLLIHFIHNKDETIHLNLSQENILFNKNYYDFFKWVFGSLFPDITQPITAKTLWNFYERKVDALTFINQMPLILKENSIFYNGPFYFPNKKLAMLRETLSKKNTTLQLQRLAVMAHDRNNKLKSFFKELDSIKYFITEGLIIELYIDSKKALTYCHIPSDKNNLHDKEYQSSSLLESEHITLDPSPKKDSILIEGQPSIIPTKVLYLLLSNRLTVIEKKLTKLSCLWDDYTATIENYTVTLEQMINAPINTKQKKNFQKMLSLCCAHKKMLLFLITATAICFFSFVQTYWTTF